MRYTYTLLYIYKEVGFVNNIYCSFNLTAYLYQNDQHRYHNYII